MARDHLYLSMDHRFYTYQDPKTGKFCLSIQISLGAVDYSIEQEIAEEVARHPEEHMEELLPLVQQLRREEEHAAYERMMAYARSQKQ